MSRRFTLFCALLMVCTLVTSCGGGGGGSGEGGGSGSSGGGGGSSSGATPLSITTTSLPNAVAGQPYSQRLSATSGTPPYVWSTASGPSPIPSGLSLSADGTVAGTPAIVSAPGVPIIFGVQVRDAAGAATQAQISIIVVNPRNDFLTSATPLSNGSYSASISPVSEPPAGVIAPDTDYYKISANPGAIVTVEITAARLTPPSHWDSFLEFVDASNSRLSLCNSNPSNQSGPFTNLCANDDISSVTTDSKLVLQVPSGSSSPLTFYAHVLDWGGNARPDFLYTITISGAN